MNIFEKLLAISAEIDLVAKNLEIGYGNQKYKAVSEGDVLAAGKPLEIKYFEYITLRKFIKQNRKRQQHIKLLVIR